MKKIWKPIKGYEDYYKISNYGEIIGLKRIYKYVNRIVNNPRISKERIIKSHNKFRYLQVGLYKNKKQKMFYVHRLVAETFIPNTENKPCVNHKDCNKHNNRVDNLEWVTYSENTIHAINNDLIDFNPRRKLTEEDVIEIKNMLNSNLYKQVEIAKKFDVSTRNIRCILNKETWVWV